MEKSVRQSLKQKKKIISLSYIPLLKIWNIEIRVLEVKKFEWKVYIDDMFPQVIRHTRFQVVVVIYQLQ